MTDPVELSFQGPETPIPTDVVPLTVRFARGGRVVEVPGFWDGGTTYRVRFDPDEPGTWTWTTAGASAELDGRSGEIDAPPRDGHGGVRVAATYHFAHADRTPFRPVGATVYNWLHQSDERLAETVDAVAGAGLNKLRFLVFPQAGNHTGGEPALMPFERGADGRWDVARAVPAFFQRLDDAVRRLGAAGIQADVLIFNAYDGGHYGLDGLTEGEDAAYLRYLVARLSGFSNVWWSLCNEFDILDRPTERWTRAGELLAAVDPHDRLRSIHQWGRLYDHNHAWVTHASIQNGAATAEPGRASMYREVYPKPIVLDEILYEGDEPERWGHLTGEELVHRFWTATVEGCYASHGESYVKPNGSLHIVEGGPFQGSSPVRLGFLRGILDDLEVPGLDPIDHWWDEAYVSGVPRRAYMQYFGRSAPATWTFRLPQGNRGERLEVGDRFEVDVIDAWDMTVTPVGRVFTLTDVQRNDAYADGDPVALPEGRMLALRISRAR